VDQRLSASHKDLSVNQGKTVHISAVGPLNQLKAEKMSKRKRVRKKHKAPKGSTRAKGDIVEEIAASMHQMPGVTVERNVFLPAKDGSGREREIDVLMSSQVAGYPVRIAIECKNQEKPIEVGDISEFVGKLLDVGIPSQHGIYISRSQYRSGASLHAKSAGIKAFLLEELSSDFLSESIRQAFQSLIYLLASIAEIQVENDVAQVENDWQILVFCDEDGHPCTTIPDLVWQEWISGRLPDDIGLHHLTIKIPDDWMQIVDGKAARVGDVEVDIKVTGHVVTIPGSVSRYELVDASSHKTERSQVKAEFEVSSDRYPVTAFTSEEELQKFIHRDSGVNLSIGRFRLPRIRLGAIYWPPSERVAQEAISLMQAFTEGKIPDPRPFKFAEMEGSDMRELWAPIWSEYPFAKKSAG
jgi:hypothetical protein